MNFSTKLIRTNSRGEQIIDYHEGPIIEFDGNAIGTVFDILCQTGGLSTSRKRITDYLISRHVPTTPGVYVIDNGTRSSVITTANIASSIAKVILDGLYADRQSDGFAKRVASSAKITISLRSTTRNYTLAAKIAGMLDNLTPKRCLSDTKTFYRKYPSYMTGLLESRNFNTYLIETYLNNNIVPEFITKKDLKFWRGSDFTPQNKCSAQEFMDEKNKLLGVD